MEEYFGDLFITTSLSFFRGFLRSYLIIIIITVLVLALTNWRALIIMWSISTELRKILILALITIGDYRLHGWSLWYRVEALVLRGRILQTRCSLVEIFNVRV
jgi:hypothetical protein